jgi:triacylglycerol lipase
MIRICFRAKPRSCIAISRSFTTGSPRRNDPRLQDLGRVLKDEYAVLRDDYSTVAHDLF